MQAVVMPKMGITMTSAVVVGWKKNIGDQVAIGEPLYEIETDKSTLLIESPFEGILKAIVVENGIDVDFGETVAYIGDADEEVNL